MSSGTIRVSAVYLLGTDYLLKQGMIPFKDFEDSDDADPGFYTQRFTCAGEIPRGGYCSAPAKASKKYIRDRENRRISVSGFFYLDPPAVHHPGCPLDIQARVHVLRENYPELIVVEDDLVILMVPAQEQWFERQVEDNARTRVNSDSLPVIHRTKPRSEAQRRVRRVQLAAAEIAEILEDNMHDEDAKARFKVRYQRETYRWDEFFFDVREGTRNLYQVATKNLDTSDCRPIAIVGRIGAVDTPTKSRQGGLFKSKKTPHTH